MVLSAVPLIKTPSPVFISDGSPLPSMPVPIKFPITVSPPKLSITIPLPVKCWMINPSIVVKPPVKSSPLVEPACAPLMATIPVPG